MISDLLEIFLLSIIQGVSEFLPVSSAAHLIIASNIYEFTNQSLLIDISLHLGSLLAILFYFKDDIFDYGFSNDIGKPTGIDIKERKLTLPLIHVLQKVSKEKRRLIVNTIKKDKQDPAKVKKIISMVIENGGIDYAERKMNEYKDLAIKELEKLPPSSAKEAFIGLIHYSINRKK